jgi:hypothetical protein
MDDGSAAGLQRILIGGLDCMIRSNREEVNPDWATDATASASIIKQTAYRQQNKATFQGAAPHSRGPRSFLTTPIACLGVALLCFLPAPNVVKSCFLLVVLGLSQEHRPFGQS